MLSQHSKCHTICMTHTPDFEHEKLKEQSFNKNFFKKKILFVGGVNKYILTIF